MWSFSGICMRDNKVYFQILVRNFKKLIMKKSFVLTIFVFCLLGCKNENGKKSSFQIGKDSIAIIYTKVLGNIYRPRWEESRNFEVTGKIMNFSQVTSYKDFVVEVDYKSKTGTLLETRKYTFEVMQGVNKIEVKKAVEEIFKVNVIQVNMINVRKKERRVGKYEGFRPAVRKAIVTLAEGQTLDVFEV